MGPDHLLEVPHFEKPLTLGVLKTLSGNSFWVIKTLASLFILNLKTVFGNKILLFIEILTFFK